MFKWTLNTNFMVLYLFYSMFFCRIFYCTWKKGTNLPFLLPVSNRKRKYRDYIYTGSRFFNVQIYFIRRLQLWSIHKTLESHDHERLLEKLSFTLWSKQCHRTDKKNEIFLFLKIILISWSWMELKLWFWGPVSVFHPGSRIY